MGEKNDSSAKNQKCKSSWYKMNDELRDQSSLSGGNANVVEADGQKGDALEKDVEEVPLLCHQDVVNATGQENNAHSYLPMVES